MDIVYILLGILLLMLGRKLFWLFVGGIGFVFGLEYSSVVLQGSSQGTILVTALVLAIIGVVLAFVVQKAGIAVAGFLSGGYIALSIIHELGINIGWLPWVVFLAGGCCGVILVKFLFDWALVVLSSLTGALLIIETVHFSLRLTKILFFLLLSIGIVAQAGQLQKRPEG
ncbi:MAG: hypothetical protein KJ893_04040 [Candidatus Omnitrophica bacterium]|nr:hypothetical protein [Candidatus Omnitrophota bacterium]MBU4478726.1 hypothetical protein [Candidatus Omnitrophota bacterium]